MTDAVPTQGSNRIRMGMLQPVQLAQAFAEQAEELHVIHEKTKKLEAELETLREREKRHREMIELGERQMDHLRRETESRLRAITLYTQDEDRLASLRNQLAQPDLSPRELIRWHERISEEFRLLYPTRPLSEPSCGSQTSPMQAESLHQFRFRSNPERLHKSTEIDKEKTDDSHSR